MKLQLHGTVQGGSLKLVNRELLSQWLAKHEGKPVELVIQKKRKRRSNQQSAYYWGVVIQMLTYQFNQLGHHWSEEDTHAAMKAKFNPVQVVGIEGEIIELPGTTTTLTTVDFEIYLDKIRLWAAEFLGLHIPAPNEPMQIDFLIATPISEQVTLIEKG